MNWLPLDFPTAVSEQLRHQLSTIQSVSYEAGFVFIIRAYTDNSAAVSQRYPCCSARRISFPSYQAYLEGIPFVAT